MRKIKKYLVPVLLAALLFSLGACGPVGTEVSDPSGEVSDETTQNSAAESSEPPEEVPSEDDGSLEEWGSTEPVATQITEEGESGSLPRIDGPEDFLNLFDGNEIDTYYLTEIANASSVASMVEVTNRAAQAWETQMKATYDSLYLELSSSAPEETARLEREQTAWTNDINVTVEEIREAAPEGSMANVEISYGVMLMYRGRCVALLSELYSRTDGVEIHLTPSEAVG